MKTEHAQADQKTSVSIVIPAFNEAQAISKDISTIITAMEGSGYDYEIIVVDDGSTDGTGDIAEAMGVKVVRHPENKGVGVARTTGVRCASGSVIVMTDADNSYPNEDIPRLLSLIGKYDMVIGARTKEAGSLPWLRKPVKTIIRKLAEYVTSERIADLNSGFRAFKRNLALRYINIMPEGHSWVGTMTLAFLSEKRDVAYIPIDYKKRVGKSTFHPIADSYNYVVFLVKTVMYFKPLKVFVPICVMLLLLGLVKSIYDSFVLHDFKESDILIILTGVLIGVLGLLADLQVKLHKQP